MTAKDSEIVKVRAARSCATWLYFAAAVLALAGLGDAVYLTVKHLTGESLRCTISGGCNEVLGSAYATIGSIPLAAFGAVAYFSAFSLATLAAFGYRRARSLLAALVALMLAMTIWLLFVQAFILHKFCEYCLLSAVVTFFLAAIMTATHLIQGKAR